jgi:hypothetical protein
VKTVVLLSTRRLPPAYFDTVREDLGGDPDLGLDVIGWVAPAGPVEDKVNSFTLIGPGRMPVAPEPEPAADPTEEAPDAVIAPEAVAEPKTVTADEAEVAPAAAEVSEAEPEPAPAPKPMPTGMKRVVKAVQWRYRRARRAVGRRLPKAIQKSSPVKFLRGSLAGRDLGKTYWARVLSRRDVMSTIEQADVVIALDAGAIWAGWNLGQRRPNTPVVLGLPAARRELDQLKASAGNG